MSNRELRSALFARYRVTLKRRWYFLLLIILYMAMGISNEFNYMKEKDLSKGIITIAVFTIIGVVSIYVLEITKHERCQYLIPLNYEERKRYYLIGALINFTIMLVFCIGFIIISYVINREFGLRTTQLFAIGGLPYIEVVSFQKINMFKGKKKKDNPKVVYISYIYSIAIGIGIVLGLSYLNIWMNDQLYLSGVVIITNLIGLGRVFWCVYQIIVKDTDYENIKINQLLVMKKMM